jgi:hypothetical protein
VGKQRAQRRVRGSRYDKRSRLSVGELIANHGTVAQFARDLSRIAGVEISWARVNGWKVRNNIPKSMLLHVHNLTGVPLSELL